MKYIIKHPVFGLYTGHVKAPRFRRKRGLEAMLEFASIDEARAVLKNRKEYPGLEDCVIEEMKE